MPSHVLALDQGTTSSRSILFAQDGTPSATAQEEFEQIYPQPGHVEHNPEAIWKSQLNTAQQVFSRGGIDPADVAAIGITNQRETVVLWEKETGKPISNAIVWQSRITTPICEQLKADGVEPTFRQKTGLLLDPYFSGTKVKYLLDKVDGSRARAEKGEILFGTVDSYLIWRLTGGRVHATDVTNASRTLLFNIHTLDWDDELLGLLGVPRVMLPEVKPSSGMFGETDPSLFGVSIPIAGCAGDQQAATFGQACFAKGDAKNTYGTGCFMLMNTGTEAVPSEHGLLTTIGWSLDGDVTYCLEGSIFIAGAVVQWLRDGLGVIENSTDVEALASQVTSSEGVYFVPAFVGLGAPHWDANARGTIVGITRGTTKAHIARAAVESMAYQTRDLLSAMEQDSGAQLGTLKVDGGACANDALMQFQCDLLGVPIRRPVVQETTALGAAYLAGLAVGFWTDQNDIVKNWVLDREFTPTASRSDVEKNYTDWQRAVERSRNWILPELG